MSHIAIVGAFERDNFGDILFGKIAAEILSDVPTIRASLLSADMSSVGGDICACIDDVVLNLETRPAGVLCLGGETLAAPVDDAIRFDLPEHEACIIEKFDADARSRWLAHSYPARPLAYLFDASDFMLEPAAFSVAYHSVGGMALQLPALPSDIADAAIERIRRADLLCVRDTTTQAAIRERTGIEPAYAPDAAFAAPHLFREQFHSARRALLQARPELSERFLVFQCNQAILAHFGVAETAALIAGICERERLGLVIQPTGLAYRHDDIAQLRALAEQVRNLSIVARAWTQENRNVWTQCALIGMAQAWAGTSLHGRVLATAQAVPAVSLLNAKVEVNVMAWNEPQETAAVDLGTLEGALAMQLARAPEQHRQVASRLELEALRSFDQVVDWAKWVVASAKPKLSATDIYVHALQSEIRRLRSALLRSIDGDRLHRPNRPV